MQAPRVTPVVRYFATEEAADVAPADVATAQAAPELDGLGALEFELPRERRPSGATLVALAAAAGVLAIGLGGWAFVSSVRESDEKTVVAERPSPAARLVTLLARPGTERIPLKASVGRIVLAVGETGEGALVLSGLGPSPAGRAYQAWLIPPGSTAPASVALFDARAPVVPLSASVPRGSTVAVTLERAGGAPAPTRTPRLFAQRR